MHTPAWHDQITVELLDHHGSDSAIANAARVSFADLESWNIAPQDYSHEAETKLINYLAKHRHLTPFRHTSMTIRCKAPLHMAAQLKKHQAGLSWNEVSRRYVKTRPELFQQEFRAAPEGSIKQGSAEVLKPEDVPHVKLGPSVSCPIHEVMFALEDWYDDCVRAHIAPETIRGFMPQNLLTEWVWTGNLLAMAHIFNERSAKGAQKEVQVFADKLDAVVAPVFPRGWEALTGSTPTVSGSQEQAA